MMFRIVLAMTLVTLVRLSAAQSDAVSLRDVYASSLTVSEFTYPFVGQIALARMPGCSAAQARPCTRLGLRQSTSNFILFVTN